MKQVIMFIEQLASPFGFLSKAAYESQQNIAAKEGKEVDEEKNGDLKAIKAYEDKFRAQIDAQTK